MTVLELKDALERHLLRYGDGPVCVETRAEVVDIVKAAADKFEPVDDEPWSLVLIAEQSETS
jgi:hypothetical protein